MSITIDGTTGISGNNGSAGTPAVQGEDTNTGIFFPAADTVAVATGGAERLRVDSSGNVGIGTTSPGRTLDVFGIIRSDGTSGAFALGGNSSTPAEGAAIHRPAANTLAFVTASTERARIDSSGNLLVGTTSTFDNVSFTIAQFLGGIATKINNATSVTQISFFNPNGRVGFIATNGLATTYSTSSDYRLKENVAPMQNALDTVSQLNPVTYTWKADGSAGQGFIAHELQAVVPDCVTGEKDAVDAEGSPQYQGVDTSFLVATLVKAIQELTARVAELEAK